MAKIYLVEFIEYTNWSHDTISNPKLEFREGRYIHIPRDGFLVREEHLEFIKQWGKGFRSIKLVGELFNMSMIPTNYLVED